jgi:hypothetical protein
MTLLASLSAGISMVCTLPKLTILISSLNIQVHLNQNNLPPALMTHLEQASGICQKVHKDPSECARAFFYTPETREINIICKGGPLVQAPTPHMRRN